MKKQFVLGVGVCAAMCFICSCSPKTTVKETEMPVSVKSEIPQGVIVGPKKKVAVVDFENKTAYGKARLGTSASDILTTELAKSKRFILIERDKLDKIFAEKNLQKTEGFQPDELVQSGKILGLNAIVTGSISQFGVKTQGEDYLVYEKREQIAEATVDLRVVSVSNGKLLWSDSGRGTATQKVKDVMGMGGRAGYDETLEGEALRAAIVKFVNNIIAEIDKSEWFCYVAEYDNGNVYLDAGKESALNLNTVLKVTRPGRVIKSPSTGEIMGAVEDEVGTIQVVKYFGDNGALAKVISGNEPKLGDICRIQ